MMELTTTLLKKMLGAAQVEVESHFDALNRLDSAIGDGDHGTAIVSTFKGAVAAAEEEASLSQTLQNVGWGIMNATSGSTSSLFGSFFLGMSDAAPDDSLDVEKTLKAIVAGLASVEMMTTAKVGDKTLMDALIPAVDAMKQLHRKDPAAPLSALFVAAAEAAKRGAESTKELVAKFGRAKNLGERSAGHLDAGATSTALIFDAFSRVVLAAGKK